MFPFRLYPMHTVVARDRSGTTAARRFASVALTVLAGVLGATAHATEYDLGEIVVTARKPVVERAGTVREIDRPSIAASGARALDELLDTLPGVNVRVGGQGTPRVDVRGFRTRHVKLLLNGIPFNGAADGQFDPTLIPADWIAKVKLTSGASSQLYGDGGLGGVINVITRRGAGAPLAELAFEGGEYGHQRATASFAWGSDEADVFVTLGRRVRDGFGLAEDFSAAPFENGGGRLNADLERNSVYGLTSFRPHEDWEFGLTLQYQEGEHGIPTGIFDQSLDRFAQRPRFDRVDDEDGHFVQFNAEYTPNARWRNSAWIYQSVGTVNLNRYADERRIPIDDPSVRNTFEDEARTRVHGFHEQLEYSHDWGGTLTFMVEGRQEQYEDECVIQDVPLTIPTPAATTPVAAPAVPPESLVLDYTYLTTNNFGATTATGQSDPVARLTVSNRSGGGVDFSLQNLAASNFGAGAFLQSLLISPVAGFDPTGLAFTQAPGSQGQIGNVNFFTQLLDADGYLYPVLVNFRRPGQGDPLLTGETALWSFNRGTVSDFFGAPVSESGAALGPDMFSGIRIRGTDAAGFWGASGVDNTGGGPQNRVFVGAPAAVDPNAPPPAAPLAVDEDAVTGELLLERVCGGGAGGGDGSGGGDGDGAGGNRVERLPGFAFGRRLLTQDRAVEVLTTALEFSVQPLPALGLVAGIGQYWQADDDGDVQSEIGYNVGATWRLAPGLRLKASHARKARPPSIAQRYDPASGNDRLDFETADLWEAGLRQVIDVKSSVELTVFRHDVENLVQRDVVSGVFENVAKTAFKGLEFTASTAFIPRVRLDAAYTHLVSRDESPGTQRKQQQYTPENTLSASADVALSARVNFHLSYLRVADQVFYSRAAPLARRDLDPYSLVDFNLRYALPGRRTELYVGIDNLFDENYAESYGLPQAGRFVYGGIRFTFR